tara:strand:+ start:1354 stop:1779 length:426 start_codon:yes stop_codon:yes gene_type:complete
MHIKNKLLFVFIFWSLLGSLNAMAQSHKHHEHQHHQSAIVSPFDNKQETQSLHCLLRGHVDRLVCPHSSADKEKTPNIAKECDGKNSGSTTATISSNSEFAEANIIVQTDYSLKSNLFRVALPTFQRFIDSLDPPPIIVVL